MNMADSKLQDLIETLKKQGVESGEAASRQIVEDAEKQASEILAHARKEAENIVKAAREEADRTLKQLHSSMEIAASQFLTNLKRHIETNLLTLPLKGKLTESLEDTGYLKQLIATCVQEFMKATGEPDLTVLVSKDQKDKLADFAVQLISQLGEVKDGDRLNLKLQTNGISYGFIIGKTDGSVMLDFTSEAFLDLFLRYLSPLFHDYFKSVDLKNNETK
jgi:V/A-type H+-transporting ATPase subunit E